MLARPGRLTILECRFNKTTHHLVLALLVGPLLALPGPAPPLTKKAPGRRQREGLNLLKLKHEPPPQKKVRYGNKGYCPGKASQRSVPGYFLAFSAKNEPETRVGRAAATAATSRKQCELVTCRSRSFHAGNFGEDAGSNRNEHKRNLARPSPSSPHLTAPHLTLQYLPCHFQSSRRADATQ